MHPLSCADGHQDITNLGVDGMVDGKVQKISSIVPQRYLVEVP